MIKPVIIVIIFLLCGVWAGQHSKTILRYIERIVIDEPPLYEVNDAATTQGFSAVPLITIEWSELLPTEEKKY
jgi:hypothetical protein